MSLSDQLFAMLSLYGLPVLIGVTLIGAIGIPLPVSLMLIAAGSFVQLGDMNWGLVVGLASAAAILGDNIGYGIGRWGGRRVARRLSQFLGGPGRLKQAEVSLRRWGGLIVFLTRWLLTPLGGAINITSGVTGYPWPRFLLFDITGELLWVVLYVILGEIFSDRVQALSDLVGDLAWVFVGLFAAIILGWNLLKRFRTPTATKDSSLMTTPVSDN